MIVDPEWLCACNVLRIMEGDGRDVCALNVIPPGGLVILLELSTTGDDDCESSLICS